MTGFTITTPEELAKANERLIALLHQDPLPIEDRLEAEALSREVLRYQRAVEPEPIHAWFELTYSNYLVLPRSLLQSMPREWQRRFVDCLEEMREAFDHLDVKDQYTVTLRDAQGKIIHDPYADYQRGRRHIEPHLHKTGDHDNENESGSGVPSASP